MNVKQIEELAGHRQVSPWIVKLVQDAVMLEREACAKLLDVTIPNDEYSTLLINSYADDIRARNLDDLTSESQLRGEYE